MYHRTSDSGIAGPHQEIPTMSQAWESIHCTRCHQPTVTSICGVLHPWNETLIIFKIDSVLQIHKASFCSEEFHVSVCLYDEYFTHSGLYAILILSSPLFTQTSNLNSSWLIPVVLEWEFFSIGLEDLHKDKNHYHKVITIWTSSFH